MKIISIFDKIAKQQVEIEVNDNVAEFFEQCKREDKSELREERRHNTASLDKLKEEYNWEPIDNRSDVFEQAYLHIKKASVKEAIEKLPKEAQQLLNFAYWKQMTTREIAVMLAINHSCVVRRLKTLRKKLKELLKNFDEKLHQNID